MSKYVLYHQPFNLFYSLRPSLNVLDAFLGTYFQLVSVSLTCYL